MPQNSKRGYQIYYSILEMILILAIILWVNEYYVLKVNIIVCILYAIVSAALLLAFDIYRKHTISYIILISLLFVAGLVFFISKIDPIAWFTEAIEWIMIYNRTDDSYVMTWAYVTLGLVSIVASIIFSMLVKRLISRLLLAATIIIIFLVFAVMNIHIGKVTVGIGIFYLINIFIELSGIYYARKTGVAEKKESILYLIPVCILLAAIAVGLPSKSEPMQWTGVKSVYYTIRDQINRLVTEWEFFVGEGHEIFSISLSGYSGDGSLDNQDLESSNKIALVVTGKRGRSPIYLTGSVSDTYTGSSWEKSKKDVLLNEEEYQLDYGELLYGLSRLDPKILEDYRLVETQTMTIIYSNIKTKTFFYPLKSRWFQFDRKSPELNTEFAGITFPKAKGSSTKYNISFYEMNLRGPEFQEMLRNSDDFSYNKPTIIDKDTIDRIEKSFYVKFADSFFLRRENFYDFYRERADIIYKRYTQLPESLPSRVMDLALEITKDKESRYDKLKAIEEYLLEFEYTYNPGRVPEEADFVDYFLFDNKKGYCSSFATAMSVLARCVGIPTRYVEGFVIDYADKDDTGYLVRNSNGHAWAEAYFDGVGWIPFEATPQFHEQRYSEWAPKRKYQQEIVNIDYYKEEAYEPLGETLDSIKSETKEENKSVVIIWILVFIAIVILLMLIPISYYIVSRHRYKKDYNLSDNSRKMYKLFLRILVLLKYDGFALAAGDTLIMLSDRIKDRYMYEDIVFRNVVNVFMGYRYGEIEVTDKQLNKVEIFYRGLLNKHESETKVLKLHIQEFLFLLKS